MITLYHGGNKLDIRDGYNGGKANRFLMGFGLYCTNSYTWAVMYGRTVYQLTIDISASTASHNIEIPMNEWFDWIYVNCTKKFFTLCKKEFAERETMSVERMEIFIVNNIRSVTKLAVPFAQFAVKHGCTHAVENGGKYGGECFRIYDFNCIKKSEKATSVYDTEVQKELKRYVA